MEGCFFQNVDPARAGTVVDGVCDVIPDLGLDLPSSAFDGSVLGHEKFFHYRQFYQSVVDDDRGVAVSCRRPSSWSRVGVDCLLAHCDFNSTINGKGIGYCHCDDHFFKGGVGQSIYPYRLGAYGHTVGDHCVFAVVSWVDCCVTNTWPYHLAYLQKDS